LNLHLAYNKGAAFGVLESAGGWQRWAFIAVAIITSAVILLWGKKLGKKHKLETLALSLILGGAWGNLIDRIRVGYVIDYIDFYIGNWHWYTFNVADIAICVGAVLLVLLSFKK
ncbi:MAG TPA: signal peptidase II, partial [Gammaproteobacteria bacterium]|nr:signal peptidase II [Gammaproteobacteria bacterium]